MNHSGRHVDIRKLRLPRLRREHGRERGSCGIDHDRTCTIRTAFFLAGLSYLFLQLGQMRI